MIIQGSRNYIEAEFDNENEIEDVVINNSEYFFGPSSIFLPKKLIKTRDGFGTIPDGFALDLSSRRWYVVEVELLHHSVWNHIAPQIAKQLVAMRSPESRQVLEEIVIQMIGENSVVEEKFREENIPDIDIRKVVGSILKKDPIVGMPIDKISQDLRDWAETLKNDIKLWLVKKYIEFDNTENTAYEIPEEYRPIIDTTTDEETSESGFTTYDVSVSDLIEEHMLEVGEELIMTYKPRGGKKRRYEAEIADDGSLIVLGKKIKSPSYAALVGIQDAGSDRQTVNGWTSWKTADGRTLSELREEYLEKKDREVEQAAAAELQQD